MTTSAVGYIWLVRFPPTSKRVQILVGWDTNGRTLGPLCQVPLDCDSSGGWEECKLDWMESVIDGKEDETERIRDLLVAKWL